MKKRVKIGITVLVGFVVLLIVLGVVGPLLIDVAWVRELIVEQAQSALGREVKLGEVKLRLIPSIRLSLTDLEIAESEEFGEGPFVKMGRLQASVKLFPLLKKRVAIGNVVLVEPAISVVRSEDGKFSFADIAAREPEEDVASAPAEETPPEETAAPAAERSSAPPAITIAGIEIRQAALKFLDKQTSPPTAIQVDNFNVKVRDLSLTAPIKFDVSADALGGSFSAKGSLRPTPPLENMRADVDVTLQDMDLSLVKSYAQGFQSKRLSGQFTVSLNDDDQTARWSGNLSLGDYAVPVPNRPGGSVGGARFSIDGAASAGYDAKAASFEGKIQVESLALAGLHPAVSKVNVGSFEFDGKGSLAAGSTVADVQGKTTLSKLSATAGTGEGRWDVDIEKLLLDLAADCDLDEEKRAVNATISLNLDSVGARGAGGKAYSVPAFRIDKAVAKLLDNEVSFTLPNVALGKTAFNGSGKVTLPEQGDLAYDVAFDFGNVALDELAGIVPEIAAYKTSGNLSLSVAARGTGGQMPSTLKSKLDFKNVGVAPPQLGLPVKNLVGTADVTLSTKEESAKLTGLAFSMGGTKVQVGADLNSLRVPKGSFTVSADNIDVEKLMPPKQEQPEPAARRPAAEKPAQPKAPADESPLKGADLSGKITVGKGRYKTVEFGNTEVAFRLKDGAVTVNRLYSAVSGGEVDGSVKAAKVFEQPALSGKMALKDIDIKPLLALSESAKGMVEGRVSGNLQFDAPRLDPERMLKRLKANGNVTVPRGQFNGFDLAKKLESVSQMSGVSELGPENTVFRDLTVDFAVANEQATISSMAMKLENFDVGCSGTYGLDKSLDMRAQAILSEQLSAKNRGSDVQSYFENEEGRVVVPFVASGTLPRVSVKLDMERVSKKAVEKGVEKLREEIMEEIVGKKEPGEEEKPEEKLLREVGTQLLDQILKP